jgi:predicted transcriptional regulator
MGVALPSKQEQVMRKVQVHADDVQAMGQRSVSAWHRAASGEAVAEAHVTFLDLEAMLSSLSPRRLAMLRHARQHGASSTRSLADALARDPKKVRGDTSALEAAGLLVRDGRKLAAPWDAVLASVNLM